jgi:glycerophosphoryl diester phosphodiesterase
MSAISWLKKRPIAHRGFHDMNKSRWENTLPAFAAAAERGYDIECDVQLSADGEVVVFHDHDLKRLTGTEGFVWQRTARELAALRVGKTADHVPTLAEMLALVRGRAPLVIELKGVPGRDAGLVRKVARALKDYRGKVAIMSFDHWLIREFPEHAPGIPAGLTATGDRDHELEAHFSMLGHGLSFVSYSYVHLPNPFVRFVRERLKMPVITWTVRDQAGIERTLAEGDQMTFEGFDPVATA